MIIQWYPGHMNKALKQMQKDAKLVDALIYVLDARAPYSCLNPKFDVLIGQKPVLFILNKADLSDEVQLKSIQNELNTTKSSCIAICSVKQNSSNIIVEKLEKLLKDKIQRNLAKGVIIPNRAMIIGVPNCGKSTIANNLCGTKHANTGDKPGITRTSQWVKISKYLEVLDTPGTLWPSFENQVNARNLAYIGSIKDDVIDIEELALAFIQDIKLINFGILAERYSLDNEDENLEPIEIFEKICINRKFLLKNKETDWTRGAKSILDDYRKGRMGNFILNQSQGEK